MEVLRIGLLYKIPTQNKKWSFFKKTKEDLSEKFNPFLMKMNTMKKNVKIIHCDNTGENMTIR